MIGMTVVSVQPIAYIVCSLCVVGVRHSPYGHFMANPKVDIDPPIVKLRHSLTAGNRHTPEIIGNTSGIRGTESNNLDDRKCACVSLLTQAFTSVSSYYII